MSYREWPLPIRALVISLPAVLIVAGVTSGWRTVNQSITLRVVRDGAPVADLPVLLSIPNHETGDCVTGRITEFRYGGVFYRDEAEVARTLADGTFQWNRYVDWRYHKSKWGRRYALSLCLRGANGWEPVWQDFPRSLHRSLHLACDLKNQPACEATHDWQLDEALEYVIPSLLLILLILIRWSRDPGTSFFYWMTALGAGVIVHCFQPVGWFSNLGAGIEFLGLLYLVWLSFRRPRGDSGQPVRGIA